MNDQFQGFSPDEAEYVKRDFVCAICHSELLVVQLDGEFKRLLVCPEHGNVELSGRITRNTASIEMERSKNQFYKVVRNLPDLWGELITEGFLWDDGIEIARKSVCKECGRDLYPVLITGDRDHVNISCPTHGNINKFGYKEKKHAY